jgi:predicted transglutaminase-like cysteine proteinase
VYSVVGGRGKDVVLLSIIAIVSFVAGFIVASTTNIHLAPTLTRRGGVDVEEVIKSYLEAYPYDREIREVAINILKSYVERSGLILRDTIHVGAGVKAYVRLKLYRDIIYELNVVSNCTIKPCDLVVRLVDQGGELAQVYSSIGSRYISLRGEYLRLNFTLASDPGGGECVLELDNTHSLKSKLVEISIRAYYPPVMHNEVFILFAIGHWVSMNIRYVNDPFGEEEYIAPPNETLKLGVGDCDDYATLLAVLYRSVGLNASVGLIDTNGDGKPEHAAALVYFEKKPEEILGELAKWASVLAVRVSSIAYFEHGEGVLVVVDPLFSTSRGNPWSVEHKPYKLVKVIN